MLGIVVVSDTSCWRALHIEYRPYRLILINQFLHRERVSIYIWCPLWRVKWGSTKSRCGKGGCVKGEVIKKPQNFADFICGWFLINVTDWPTPFRSDPRTVRKASTEEEKAGGKPGRCISNFEWQDSFSAERRMGGLNSSENLQLPHVQKWSYLLLSYMYE